MPDQEKPFLGSAKDEVLYWWTGWLYFVPVLCVNGSERNVVLKIKVTGPSRSQIERALKEAQRKAKQEIERRIRQATGKPVKWVKQ